MKKKYFTPEAVTVNLNVESYILNDSTRIPVGNDGKPSLSNSNRGEWGNLWSFGYTNRLLLQQGAVVTAI